MFKMKKLLSMALAVGVITSMSTTAFAANDFAANDFVANDEFSNAIPQVVISEKRTEANGNITHEYVWGDKPMLFASENDQLGYAKWIETDLSGVTLKHRGAKISPDVGSYSWYACSQTDYAKWHFSRARIIMTISGKILQDSNQVQVNSGVATARTPTDKLYLMDWDFNMRSYLGV